MTEMTWKWRVAVTFKGNTQVFWISDSRLSNVMRLVASMDFSDGPEQPTKVTIGVQK
jgi:hypothetical protein